MYNDVLVFWLIHLFVGIALPYMAYRAIRDLSVAENDGAETRR